MSKSQGWKGQHEEYCQDIIIALYGDTCCEHSTIFRAEESLSLYTWTNLTLCVNYTSLKQTAWF